LVPGAKHVLGITQLAVVSVAMEPGLPASDPRLAKALAYMEGFKQPNGSVCNPGEGLANYCTSLALQAWAASKTGSSDDIRAAQNFLFGLQNTDPTNPNRGGIGYGSRGAGNEDLSNTSFAIAGLKASGIKATDPRMQEALKFLERCQNLSSVNKLPWVTNDGGGVYSPDESKAGGSWDKTAPPTTTTPTKLASYGSMTYALISSYIALDLTKDDPRVQAALAWAKDHYQFDVNPGMSTGKELQGLYYYYNVLGKTYDLIDATTLTLKDGRIVDWRADLFAAIKSRAKIDGDKAYWINSADRWTEGSPYLCTAYMLTALKRIYGSLP
jgi:squalene-hopene/tetraprenyl-beta-curcumene cyclase